MADTIEIRDERIQYIWVHPQVFQDERLSPIDRLTYMYLAYIAGVGGGTNEVHYYLGQDVTESLDRLEEFGYIIRMVVGVELLV